MLPGSIGITGTSEPGSGPVMLRPRLNGPRVGAPACGLRPIVPPVIPPAPVGDMFMAPEGGALCVVGWVVVGVGDEVELVLFIVPVNVNSVRAVGSATVKSPTTLLVATPAVGPLAVSEPDPTVNERLKPPAAAAAAAVLGLPVMLPGFKLDIPPPPVMYRLVGIGKPLTEAELPPPELLAPSEPDAELLAPGNGVTMFNPLVVSRMIAKFEIDMRGRSSSMHSFRSGRNIKRLFILHAHAKSSTASPDGIPRLPLQAGLTSQSAISYDVS